MDERKAKMGKRSCPEYLLKMVVTYSLEMGKFSRAFINYSRDSVLSTATVNE